MIAYGAALSLEGIYRDQRNAYPAETLLKRPKRLTMLPAERVRSMVLREKNAFLT